MRSHFVVTQPSGTFASARNVTAEREQPSEPSLHIVGESSLVGRNRLDLDRHDFLLTLVQHRESLVDHAAW